MSGYYRFPTLHGDAVLFVSEDDLWSVPAAGGVARRLTATPAAISHPILSPDGRFVAFASREEGHPEAFVMPAQGGPVRRLTYLSSAFTRVVAWTPDGASVVIASSAGQPFYKFLTLHSVPRDGGAPTPLGLGPSQSITWGPRGARVIARFGLDPAWWKRYRGGRAGQLLIDPAGRGIFTPLITLKGNLANPMWMDGRVHFLSDHEGTGNLYSCLPTGRDLRRHTDHADFYARNASSDGRRIVYHAGADLYLYDGRASRRIDVEYPSSRPQRNRKYVEPDQALEEFAPSDDAVAITARGRLFTMAPWEGPATEHGAPRMRLARWLPGAGRLVALSDDGGEESILTLNPTKRIRGKFGRAIDMECSPKGDQVAIANHRHELVLVNLKNGRTRIVDRSDYDRLSGLAWSPDGRWVAYGFARTSHLYELRIVDTRTGRPRSLTRPVLRDVSPAFDPDGRYLYFLSYRDFDPVYDNVHFDLGFPRAVRPHLVVLQKDLPSPFTGEPPSAPKKKQKSVRIDWDGIHERVVAFPVPEGRYADIAAIPNAAIWTIWPVEGSRNQPWPPGVPAAKAHLEMYDLGKRKKDSLVKGISSFRIGGKTLVYRAGNRLRWLKAGEHPDEKTDRDPPGRESGWLNLDRLRLLVEPSREWAQMYREAWRLMRDHFWVADMSGVDWDAVYKRYLPLVGRAGSRTEFSDIVWEMQGELGTSHCYEFGGDYRPNPRYDVGLLGADFAWAGKGWKISRIVRGDSWDDRASSPLAAPGLNLREGDVITAVNGRPADRRTPIGELLLNQAGAEVSLTLAAGRTVRTRTLSDETAARYREWVERNRRTVHERAKGRVGYVHVPDMGPAGYAEFHRGYLAELDRDALIIDVRNNGGGHVSQLLLEKLLRKRVGYDISRWGRPAPYPGDSPAGPLVALTNEGAGSDGDIFSHCFKLFKLGPLIGRRTWGGVIGIWPRHALADGSVTTQPEFSFWFRDAGFAVENYGTDPDIDIDYLPQDYARARDPQLERGLEEALRLLKSSPPLKPDATRRPSLTPPKLPRR